MLIQTLRKWINGERFPLGKERTTFKWNKALYKYFHFRRVSCETLCSSNSSCVLQKRKPLHPLARSVQTRTSNSIAQRVLSAKFLRFKTLQNQLNDANFHIAVISFRFFCFERGNLLK